MKTDEKAKVLPEPSDEFKDAFTHTGSVVIDCELCGRTYFGREMLTTGDSTDAKEYETLKKKAEKEPDKYIELSDSISWGTIMTLEGEPKQAVVDCKCHGLAAYEKLFWNNRYIIAHYLRERSQNEAKAANEQKKELSDTLTE